MGTVSDKLSYLNQTKGKIKEIINYSGDKINNETTFRDYPRKLFDNYIDILNDKGKELWNNLPHVSNEVSNDYVALENTTKAPMKIEIIPQTSQKNTLLPSEYYQLDYLESDGASVINIPFYPSNLTRILTKFSGLSNADSTWAFGSRVGSVSNEFGFYATTGYRDAFDNNRQVLSGYDLSSGIVLDKNKEITTINGTYTLTHPTRTFTCQNSLSIFALNNNGSVMVAPAKIKMYYFTIYENEVLVHNLIPAKRKSDEVLGMYDTVGNQFYTNQGTGAFTYGSIVNVSNQDFPMDIHSTTGENNVKVAGKNLFNVNTTNENKYIDGTNGILYDSTASNSSDFIEIKSNSNYTLSFDYTSLLSSNTRAICFYDSNKQRISHITYGPNYKSFNMVTPENAYYIRFTYDKDCFNVQFEEGSTATPYTPHEETTYPISLGTKEMFNINGVYDSFVYNDNEDKFYIERRIGKVVLNGSERGWSQYTGLPSAFLLLHQSGTPFYNKVGNYGGYSNNYLVQNGYQTWTGKGKCGFNNVGTFWLMNTNDTINTLELFKNWLSTHNTIVVYQLATATLEEITDTTLISQLRAIKNALSPQGTTHIISTATGENLPFLIKASAVKSFE